MSPPSGRSLSLTKTWEWNLRWCVLDHMFDDQFRLRAEFLDDPGRLQQRESCRGGVGG